MKILLPPSETKRPGGDGIPLDVESLALPALASERLAVIDALIALVTDEPAALRVLRLSERQRGDVSLNRMLRTAPTMPAIDRYTGVLYDALDAGTLDQTARGWLDGHVLIHSALFGPIAALDAIPAYRLSAGTSLPGAVPLRRHWSAVIAESLAGERFVLDLRSEAYVALGPVPASVPSAYVRVVTASGRALNHFNKKAKGELVRRFAETGLRGSTLESVLAWAGEHAVPLRPTGEDGLLELVVEA